MPETVEVPTAPGRLPLVGHLFKLLGNPMPFLESLRAQGDIVRVFFGPLEVYVILRPQLFHEVLVRKSGAFRKGRLLDKVRSFLGNGLLTSEGEFHHRQRRLMQPAFHRRRIAEYVDLMRRNAEGATADWRPGQAVDLQELFDDLSLRNVSEALFSSELGQASHDEVLRWLRVVMRGAAIRTLAPTDLLQKLPTPGNRRFDEANTRFRRVVDEVIRTYRADDVDRGDLLSMVLAARDEETGRGMTDAQARDELQTLLLAGAETTASAMGSLFHEVSRHPAVARRLHGELDEVLGGRPLRYEDIARLEYTRCVVDEALRLATPVWMTMRRTATEVTLGEARLPAGAEILLSFPVVHRDPDAYPDPLAFDPDRWLRRGPRDLPPGAYLPFAAGNRKCIGDHFAWMELLVTMAVIGSRWRLEPAPGHRPKRIYRTVTRMSRLTMTAVPRAQTGLCLPSGAVQNPPPT
ncbi:cytochrome P450 [Pseudonocardia acaciae]|uniref:cytochrome P450 n=1 Tax=Pseudonocardia acaciae TaxID=551276 RepID=UPI000684EED7|nr:cytochrome P450 [Pseudonocardia acaciae]